MSGTMILGFSVPGIMLVGALAVSAAALGWRVRRGVVAGRPAQVDLARGLAQWPRRYLVHVHDAVRRDPAARTPRDNGASSALMHALTAGGFLAAVALIALVHVLGVDAPAAAGLLLLALAVMSLGLVLLFRRRIVGALPPRLVHGPFDRLPWALAGFVVFFGWSTLPAAGLTEPVQWTSPLALVLVGIGGLACAVLFAGTAFGPMRHAGNGALHLAVHPRPARFDRGAPDAAIRPLDLGAPRLGANRPEDFAWNQRLGFEACVECGRCDAVCPALAAGQPLSPRTLIQRLSEAAPSARPAGDTGLGLPLSAGIVGADELWACTTCRACVDECPMMIEHVDAIIELRRFQTLELGAVPGRAGDALDALRETDTVSGKRVGDRIGWAADQHVPRLADVGRCDVLLWIGEGGFELRNQRALRALVKLLQAADVDFAVLGDEELDCGDLARRLGDEATFESLARRNIEALDRYVFGRIVTADPHALHTLRNEYPPLGGRYTVEHHSSLLARLLLDGRLAVAGNGPSAAAAAVEPTRRPRRPLGTVTFHDPCYLGRYQGELDAPRRILSAIGVQVREMERSRRRSSCCGWGGGAAFTDVPGERRIPDVRIDHARATGADTVAVACPNCAVMLEGVVQPRPEVADIAELLWAAVERSAAPGANA